MDGLTKSELRNLGKSIELKMTLMSEILDDGKWWIAHVESKESTTGKTWELVTVSGKRKLFRTTDAAVEFIEQACPSLESISIKLRQR